MVSDFYRRIKFFAANSGASSLYTLLLNIPSQLAPQVSHIVAALLDRLIKPAAPAHTKVRSEERRVGKECVL